MISRGFVFLKLWHYSWVVLSNTLLTFMKNYLIVFLILLSTNVQAQRDQIIKIEFQSLSRAYSEMISITPDSIKDKKIRNRGKETITNSAIPMKKWNALIRVLDKIELKQIPELSSPTMKRAYDGARHSSLKIFTSTKSYEHLFDDENPNAKLLPLMRCINSIIK